MLLTDPALLHEQTHWQIHWRQVSQSVVEVWIDMDRPLSGYDYRWETDQEQVRWILNVKTLPRRLSDLRILIDPGHGGPEHGATGPNGMLEKDLNLSVSHYLKEALLNQSAQHVFMTREHDEEVSLPTRSQAAIDHDVDIVLSIHHNALPDGRDPLKAKGASTYYYHAFSKPLAETLLDGLCHPYNLTRTSQLTNYGLFYDSLHMTRIHQAMAVLIEVGFFTCPEEFEQLIDPTFQQKAAQHLVFGLREFEKLTLH